MSTSLPIATPAVDKNPQGEPLGATMRIVLAGAAGLGLLVLSAVGLAVFVMVVNNWNLLNWLE